MHKLVRIAVGAGFGLGVFLFTGCSECIHNKRVSLQESGCVSVQENIDKTDSMPYVLNGIINYGFGVLPLKKEKDLDYKKSEIKRGDYGDRHSD